MKKNRSPAHICTPDQSACIPYHADCITKLKGLLGTAILLFIHQPRAHALDYQHGIRQLTD
jgi:hypothetical protein